MLATKADVTTSDLVRRQRQAALSLLLTVVLVDQITKWWAWRFASKAIINTGSTWFIDGPVSEWFRDPVTGRFLDLANVVLLSVAGVLLVRRPRRPLLLVAGSLMLAGWGSNLLDRLGLHALTAPDTVRGAVDFIPLGPAYYNVADQFIVAATVLYLVAAFSRCRRSASGAARLRVTAAPRTWSPAVTSVAVVGLVVAAAVGAENDGGVEHSRRAAERIDLRR
jgi:lipoprotein signal peptidase